MFYLDILKLSYYELHPRKKGTTNIKLNSLGHIPFVNLPYHRLQAGNGDKPAPNPNQSSKDSANSQPTNHILKPKPHVLCPQTAPTLSLLQFEISGQSISNPWMLTFKGWGRSRWWRRTVGLTGGGEQRSTKLWTILTNIGLQEEDDGGGLTRR
jgi:hypothetical protein